MASSSEDQFGTGGCGLTASGAGSTHKQMTLANDARQFASRDPDDCVWLTIAKVQLTDGCKRISNLPSRNRLDDRHWHFRLKPSGANQHVGLCVCYPGLIQKEFRY